MAKDNFGKCGFAAIVVLALIVGGGALAIRYGLLENGVLPRDCTVAEAPAALCAFKTTLVQGFLHQRVGWVSLICGLLAFVLGSRRFAWAGWASGLAGLVFYSYDPAAVGALLALLVLARPRAEHDGQGERDSGEQPADGLRVRRLG